MQVALVSSGDAKLKPFRNKADSVQLRIVWDVSTMLMAYIPLFIIAEYNTNCALNK